mgnify:CR=1 FL=1
MIRAIGIAWQSPMICTSIRTSRSRVRPMPVYSGSACPASFPAVAAVAEVLLSPIPLVCPPPCADGSCTKRSKTSPSLECSTHIGAASNPAPAHTRAIPAAGSAPPDGPLAQASAAKSRESCGSVERIAHHPRRLPTCLACSGSRRTPPTAAKKS